MYHFIKNAGTDELQTMLQQILQRYRELCPGYEIFTFTMEKAEDKNQQLDQAIALLEHLKDRQPE